MSNIHTIQHESNWYYEHTGEKSPFVRSGFLSSSYRNMKAIEGLLFSQFIHSGRVLAGKSKKYTRTHTHILPHCPGGT